MDIHHDNHIEEDDINSSDQLKSRNTAIGIPKDDYANRVDQVLKNKTNMMWGKEDNSSIA